MLPWQAQSMSRGSKNRESLGLGWCQLLVSTTRAVGTCLYMEPSELHQGQLKRFPVAAGQLGHGPAYLFILSLLCGSEQSPIWFLGKKGKNTLECSLTCTRLKARWEREPLRAPCVHWGPVGSKKEFAASSPVSPSHPKAADLQLYAALGKYWCN